MSDGVQNVILSQWKTKNKKGEKYWRNVKVDLTRTSESVKYFQFSIISFINQPKTFNHTSNHINMFLSTRMNNESKGLTS